MSDTPAPEIRRIGGEPTGRGAFAVRSVTDRDHEWVVEWQSPKAHHCYCPKFARDGRCRHTLAVFALIAQEWQERRAAEARWPRHRQPTEKVNV